MVAHMQRAHPTERTFSGGQEELITPDRARQLYGNEIHDKRRFICGRPNKNGNGICQFKVTCRAIDSLHMAPAFVAQDKSDIHSCDIESVVNEKYSQLPVENDHNEYNMVDSVIDFLEFTPDNPDREDSSKKQKSTVSDTGRNASRRNKGDSTTKKNIKRHIKQLPDIVEIYVQNKTANVSSVSGRRFTINELFRPIFKVFEENVKPYPNAGIIYFSEATITSQKKHSDLVIRFVQHINGTPINAFIDKSNLKKLLPNYREYVDTGKKITIFTKEKPIIKQLADGRQFANIKIDNQWNHIDAHFVLRKLD